MKNIFILIGSAVIGIGIIFLAVHSPNVEDVNAVRVENGVQIIHVTAHGGYTPNKITAKAGIPTRLEVETKGTYDCSSSFTIPTLGYKKMLPASGVTTIDLGTGKTGESLNALCGMGMYSMNVAWL